MFFSELHDLLNFVFHEVSIATLLLFLTLLGGLLLARKAQLRPDVDFVDLLRDPLSNQLSLNKFATLVSLAVTSWFMIYASLSVPKEEFSKLILYIFAIFIGVWSGAKAVEKAIDAWAMAKCATQPPSSSVFTSTSTERSSSTVKGSATIEAEDLVVPATVKSPSIKSTKK